MLFIITITGLDENGFIDIIPFYFITNKVKFEELDTAITFPKLFSNVWETLLWFMDEHTIQEDIIITPVPTSVYSIPVTEDTLFNMDGEKMEILPATNCDLKGTNKNRFTEIRR